MRKFNYKKFAEAIESKRMRKDTCEKIGEDIGLSKATVSRVLKGNSKILIDTALKMADWADIDLNNFIDNE